MAVVERVNQESIYGLYVGRKVAIRSCREVAVVERCWQLVEVRLYNFIPFDI